MGATASSGTLAEAFGDPPRPGTGGIDEDRRVHRAAVGELDLEVGARSLDRRHSDALDNPGAQPFSLVAKGEHGPEGQGGPVRARDQPAYHMRCCGRHKVPELSLVDHLLMIEAGEAKGLGALPTRRQLGLRLGQLHLAVGLEAAIVVDEILDAVPHLHRGDRKRDLGQGTAKLTNAASVHARCMATGIVLLDEDHIGAPYRQLDGGRAAVNSATDDQDVAGRHPVQPRSTMPISASLLSSVASSASVIGFTGDRRR